MSGIDISVIIPVYNDPKGLRDTLESLVDQDFEGDYEVLPVDNNSTDDTGYVIEEFESDYPELIRGFEENDIQSSYAARNRGIEEAEGEVLVFLDADMWVDERWLSEIREYFDNNDLDYLGGTVEIVVSSRSAAALFNKETGFPIESYIQNMDFAPTCSLAVRNKVFDKIGNFDSRLISGGDEEFGRRVAEKEFSQDFASDLISYHPTRDSWQSLKNKWFRVGRGDFQKYYLYPQRFSGKRTSLLEFRNILPTTPGRLKNSVSIWDKLCFREKVEFYFLYWMKKVLLFTGYQYERFFGQIRE